MTRGGFRRRVGMSMASKRAWATKALACADGSPLSKMRSKLGVLRPTTKNPRWPHVVSGRISARTARLAFSTALELGKPLLALL